MKYVIIGNSTAGIGAVEGIRQVDREGKITLISDERYHTYSRPLISYLLYGKTTEEKMKYRPDNFYEENNVEFIAGVRAEKIDAVNKTVMLTDGRVIEYGKLLVGTGSSPLVPSFEGLDTVPCKHTFMSLEDAQRLSEDLDKDKHVLIVGAGLIGLKCAEGILDKAGDITVVDLAPRILSSILDDVGAKIVQEHLKNKGLRFILGNSVQRFNGSTATLADGTELSFDILILAVGVRPNVKLLEGIAQIDRGIVINGRAETTAPDIYAAGDCTQSIDVSSGMNRIMALLPNAYMQGETAGINMAGGDKSFDKAIPMNAIGFFGLHIITAGNYSGDVYEVVDEDKPVYKKLFFSDNHLNGYIMIGDVEKAGIYTSLIRERTDLDTIDFDLICQKPGLMAFTFADRKIKLGGAGK